MKCSASCHEVSLRHRKLELWRKVKRLFWLTTITRLNRSGSEVVWSRPSILRMALARTAAASECIQVCAQTRVLHVLPFLKKHGIGSRFLPERDYVTCRYMPSQIRLSSVCRRPSSVTFIHARAVLSNGHTGPPELFFKFLRRLIWL